MTINIELKNGIVQYKNLEKKVLALVEEYDLSLIHICITSAITVINFLNQHLLYTYKILVSFYQICRMV